MEAPRGHQGGWGLGGSWRGGSYRTRAVTGQVGSHLGDRQKRFQDQSLEEKEESTMARGTIENREKKSRTREKLFPGDGAAWPHHVLLRGRLWYLGSRTSLVTRTRQVLGNGQDGKQNQSDKEVGPEAEEVRRPVVQTSGGPGSGQAGGSKCLPSNRPHQVASWKRCPSIPVRSPHSVS